MSKITKILVVDDEPAVREMVVFALEQGGFDVIEAEDAPQARTRILQDQPDLVLLDWMLPGQSGIEFAKSLRANDKTRNLAVIMLTARGSNLEKVQGLEQGADDYITKPFSPRELIARIKAVLRRTAVLSDADILEINGLRLDPSSHRVFVGDEVLVLGPTEFRLLQFFMSNPERVYSRGQLIDYVWGKNIYVEERTVDVHIRRLRKALSGSDHSRYVQTVRGAGYRLSTKEF